MALGHVPQIDCKNIALFCKLPTSFVLSQEMESAFEEDANARLTEVADLKAANDDLKDALEIVSKQADESKYVEAIP